MPRKSKTERAVEAALAALPFSPLHAADAPERYENLPVPVRKGVAEAVYRAFRVEGLSGKECRLRFGGTRDEIDGDGAGLSGHRRRRVFRDRALVGDALLDGVAPSYDAFVDGDPRKGSAHARMHGPLAEERKAEAARKLAAEDRKAELAAMRKVLRAAGRKVPRGEAKLREAHAALVGEVGQPTIPAVASTGSEQRVAEIGAQDALDRRDAAQDA